MRHVDEKRSAGRTLCHGMMLYMQVLRLVPVALLPLALWSCATRPGQLLARNSPVVAPPQIDLSWTAPTTNADGTTLTDLAGYKLYYGQASHKYSFVKDVGARTTYAVSGLAPGRTYFFAVTAYDRSGNESSVSNELRVTAPPIKSQVPVLAQEALSRGRAAQFWVIGANPGERVSYLYSLQGGGEGPCSPQLGGLCVDLLNPAVFGEAVADTSGTAVLTHDIPAHAPVGKTVSIQAVIRRGPDGIQSVKTNVISSLVTD